MKKIRLVIADDHKILRESLMILLAQQDDIEIVGEAADGPSALQQVALLQPDIVILDISLPRLNGLEIAARLQREEPNVKIIFLTMHRNEEFVARAYAAGASAYLLKENALDELMHAIRVVDSGGTFISEGIAGTVIAGFLGHQVSGQRGLTEQLSAREREILQLLAEGNTNKEIADALTLSLKTVETHRANIMRKLAFRNLADLALYAVRNHIVEP